jgi:ribosomal protein S18 acetylase RimI-like enzyme
LKGGVRVMIKYKKFNSSMIESVKEIYRKESWNSYLKDDEKLIRAFDNSLYTLGAFDDCKLIGFIRCVGDGEHILVVQDLIVDPEYQQRGIGTYLFKTIMQKYSKVRMFMVITDIEDIVDNKFYQSFNLKRLEDMNMIGYIR